MRQRQGGLTWQTSAMTRAPPARRSARVQGRAQSAESPVTFAKMKCSSCVLSPVTAGGTGWSLEGQRITTITVRIRCRGRSAATGSVILDLDFCLFEISKTASWLDVVCWRSGTRHSPGVFWDHHQEELYFEKGKRRVFPSWLEATLHAANRSPTELGVFFKNTQWAWVFILICTPIWSISSMSASLFHLLLFIVLFLHIHIMILLL